MYNQFKKRNYNISITQNVSYVVTTIEGISISSSEINRRQSDIQAVYFLQTHITFCEYLVFHEFRRNLYITLAKYLEQGVCVWLRAGVGSCVRAATSVWVCVYQCRYVCVCTRAYRVCRVCVSSS